ncbi:Retrotransposon protein [Nesidiocoris tenuis]|nr:Retrotransposon protein [Nesidiocoris tenuis]
MDRVVGSSNGVVSCVLAPRDLKGPQWRTEATVLTKICTPLPTVMLPSALHEKFTKLNLADRQFHLRGAIDFLLGASLYPEIMKAGHRIIAGEPCAIETHFGFIIMGKVPLETAPVPQVSLFVQEVAVEKLVRQFWEIEEVEAKPHVDPVQAMAESYFVKTTERMTNGSFCVRLPFRSSCNDVPFGSSYELAKKRWLNMENKLRKNPSLNAAYIKFMEEYEQLGHMRSTKKPGVFYIPHFAILKDSATSPLRVVFDGSCKDTSGLSINERLLAGPPLQQDITEIISHFRLKPVAITTDIKMMYRQIWLHEDDCQYQHVVFRKSPDLPLADYELRTVTYGLTSAPFLAQRVLRALVEQDGHEFPLASEAILNACLMDDICWSVETEEIAIEFKQQLIALLGRAKFELRKWSSNSQIVLQDIPTDHRAKVLNLNPNEEFSLRILGLQWYPLEDVFSYQIRLPVVATTKRKVSSHIASIFDPMGWLAPVVFWAKCFLQELWSEKYDWDAPLHKNKLERWAEFARQLSDLPAIKIPRLCVEPSLPMMQLVGFCDGSSLGYGCVVYLRCYSEDESAVSVQLLKAKSKVAPLRTVTIPRIELLGAVLLANLIKSLDYLTKRLNINSTILFTDATVVLAWLKTSAHLLKTFVANRVTTILEQTTLDMWRHVPTAANAADCISRGLMPSHLVHFSTWWHGPSFLRDPMAGWPSLDVAEMVPQLPELKTNPVPQVLNVICTENEHPSTNRIIELTDRRSSFSKIQRVVAYVLRFKRNCRATGAERQLGVLAVQELETAHDVLIKTTQTYYFRTELRLLGQGKLLPSNLRQLSPFVDGKGLLRVGGRLAQSSLPDSSKHPLLLPKKCALSRLICDHFHRELQHAGPQLTQATIASQYWILSMRSLIRQRIHQCLICYKCKATLQPPLMADLPAVRVTPAPKAFYQTSVDFAGPIPVKESCRRNARSQKAYIAVFCCMATKAVHVELVLSLSTPTFCAALDRFVGRRGLCRHVYCDQGTNFRGASNELASVVEMLASSQPDVAEYLAQRKIEYHFNSPASPWKGGLWEAAVKSFKTHLLKISHNQLLTYEEMLTLLVRIEAVLNSRPLCPLDSTDPDAAPHFLTPGHFLIGTALLCPPEHDFMDINETHLERWQRVQQAAQQFWRRWSAEYLNTLIQRRKWNVHRAPLQVGDPVFILQEQTPPLDWPLARVIRLLPGRDGVSRTAIVRTATGVLTRPVARLVAMPASQEDAA